MFSKGRKEGTFRFVFSPDWPAEKVALAGDFNEWEPVTMRKQKNGSFAATLPIEPGTYQYKFKVNEEWQADPDNQACVENEFGSINSVLAAE
jgi:1,4-alpha-glucan branching enzyme